METNETLTEKILKGNSNSSDPAEIEKVDMDANEVYCIMAFLWGADCAIYGNLL